MKIKSFLYGIIFFGALLGCAQKNVEVVHKNIVNKEPARDLSIAEQNKEAFNIFKEILPLCDSPDREKNLPAIKALYRKIIDNYPETGLAQESYLRLVVLAKEENSPQGDAEAVRVYEEFLQKYPNSRLQRVIENELRQK